MMMERLKLEELKIVMHQYKVLDNYINLSKAKELPRDDIIKIWTARFINNDRALHAILTHLQFAQLYTNAFNILNLYYHYQNPNKMVMN